MLHGTYVLGSLAWFVLCCQFKQLLSSSVFQLGWFYNLPGIRAAWICECHIHCTFFSDTDADTNPNCFNFFCPVPQAFLFFLIRSRYGCGSDLETVRRRAVKASP